MLRKFYKYDKDESVVIEITESESQIRMSTSDAQALVNSGEAVIYDTIDDLYEVIQYRMNREKEYPAIGEQLDQIFHEGIDAWKETIQAVKDAHPKP
jgi:hypothetical protein